jgi:hypothetical protein
MLDVACQTVRARRCHPTRPSPFPGIKAPGSELKLCPGRGDEIAQCCLLARCVEKERSRRGETDRVLYRGRFRNGACSSALLPLVHPLPCIADADADAEIEIEIFAWV